MQAKNIWVIGGDRRQAALARLLEEEGHTVHTFALERGESLKGLDRADCAILPLPAMGEEGLLNAPLSAAPWPMEEILNAMTPGQLCCGGLVTGELEGLARARGLVLKDYFAREELAVLNAIPTAEGAIQIAMEELPVTVHDSRVLIIGFGRVARALLPPLRGLGARVTVAARRPEQRALARSMGACTQRTEGLDRWLCPYDLVVNTVPAPMLGRGELAGLKEGALVIDLASRPGGVDAAAAAELGVHWVWALSLPGKVAPVTAGRYVMDTVYHIMEELGV